MSRDFHVYCALCNERHDFQDANWQEDLMRELIRNQEAIAALGSLCLGADVWLDTNYGRVDTGWFALHVGHGLVVIDEYGKVADTCGKHFKCAGCDTQHYCRLDQGHDGECKKTGST